MKLIMKQFYNPSLAHFAAPYGECAYSVSQYDSANDVCSVSTSASGGGLTDTGTMVFAFVGIAAMIVLTAMVVRIWRRPAKKDK